MIYNRTRFLRLKNVLQMRNSHIYALWNRTGICLFTLISCWKMYQFRHWGMVTLYLCPIVKYGEGQLWCYLIDSLFIWFCSATVSSRNGRDHVYMLQCVYDLLNLYLYAVDVNVCGVTVLSYFSQCCAWLLTLTPDSVGPWSSFMHWIQRWQKVLRPVKVHLSWRL